MVPRRATNSTQELLNGSRSTRLAKTIAVIGSRSKSVSSSHLSHACLVSCPYEVNGAVYNATLPKNLAPGQYLVRHEIIALHLAITKGKAEFYPSCQQLNVTGNGTGVPSSDELLSFPGAYSDDDPGIYTPNVCLLPSGSSIHNLTYDGFSGLRPRIPIHLPWRTYCNTCHIWW